MTIRFGINPIGWTNDSMQWLGDFIPVETCLAEARAAGFSGIELGRKMPKQGRALRELLERHGLRLVGGWYAGKLLQRDAKAEITALKEHLALHQACGAEIMVFAETSGEIINDVAGRRSARPQIDGAAAWKTFATPSSRCRRTSTPCSAGPRERPAGSPGWRWRTSSTSPPPRRWRTAIC